jgi:uncharacterized protein (DUF2147 family)
MKSPLVGTSPAIASPPMIALIRPILLCLAMAALPGIRSLAADSDSPIGRWKTFDDKTGSARAIVRIYEQDGKLFGKIEGSFTRGAESRVCSACTDDRKNQPMMGLLIIRNMKRADDGYAGGDILDPDSGSVYRCKLRLEQGGDKLVVRGFIGISLLGRTQNWERQKTP